MTYQNETRGTTQAVVKQIEVLILRGAFRSGARLPSKQVFSDKFGFSRQHIDQAISDLQARNLVTSNTCGDYFVTEVLGSAFTKPLVKLFEIYEETAFDYIAFRRDMEVLAIQRAVQMASDSDLMTVNNVFAKMKAAHTKGNAEDEARLDAEFHLSIIEASHNVIMLHMMRSMSQLLHEGVIYNRQIIFDQSTTRNELLNQHRSINQALQLRDVEQARIAVELHHKFIETAHADYQKSKLYEDIAKLRFKHECSKA